MVLIAVLTGLRVGEILGLRWQDVDFTHGEFRVEQAVYRGFIGSPKTRGSRRTLPLPEALVSALKALAARSLAAGAQSLVFATRNETPFGDTNLLLRELKPAGTRIGTPWVSWHTFRRTHATLLQLAGGSAKDAQVQLGHAQISTTLGIYTLPIPAHQRAAVEKLSGMVTNGDEFGSDSESTTTEVVTLQ
jgi:integrase